MVRGASLAEITTPEKRPARKLRQRVEVREAAWWDTEDSSRPDIDLLRTEAVGSAQAEGEALALEGALDSAGENKEKEAKDEDQVWVLHSLPFMLGGPRWILLALHVVPGHDQPGGD
jgi:hypothetical protein